MIQNRSILIADDHPMCSAALAVAVDTVDPSIAVTQVALMEQVETALRANRYDAIFLDLMLPDVQGMAGLAMVRQLAPTTPVAVVSSRDDGSTIRQTMALGARGFLSKSAPMDRMIVAIRVVLGGLTWFPEDILSAPPNGQLDELARRVGELSTAQLRVLRAMTGGKPNKLVAFELGLAEPTIKSHLAAIFKTLRVTNRTEAVLALTQLETASV